MIVMSNSLNMFYPFVSEFFFSRVSLKPMKRKGTNLQVLLESKEEYTLQFTNLLTPCIIQGFHSMYDYVRKHNKNETLILREFQEHLRIIPQWSGTMIEQEESRIKLATRTDWLEELLKAIYIVNIQILSQMANKRSNKPLKLNVEVPSLRSFIHKCYIATARDLWKQPFLLYHKNNKVEIQKSLIELHNMVKKTIQETIRQNLPFKDVLSHFFGNDVKENYNSASDSESDSGPSDLDSEGESEAENESVISESEADNESVISENESVISENESDVEDKNDEQVNGGGAVPESESEDDKVDEKEDDTEDEKADGSEDYKGECALVSKEDKMSGEASMDGSFVSAVEEESKSDECFEDTLSNVEQQQQPADEAKVAVAVEESWSPKSSTTIIQVDCDSPPPVLPCVDTSELQLETESLNTSPVPEIKDTPLPNPLSAETIIRTDTTNKADEHTISSASTDPRIKEVVIVSSSSKKDKSHKLQREEQIKRFLGAGITKEDIKHNKDKIRKLLLKKMVEG
jgi:hypothetical protein